MGLLDKWNPTAGPGATTQHNQWTGHGNSLCYSGSRGGYHLQGELMSVARDQLSPIIKEDLSIYVSEAGGWWSRGCTKSKRTAIRMA